MDNGSRAMAASYAVLSPPPARWIMRDSTGSARRGTGGRGVRRPRGTPPHGPPRLGSTRAREVRIRRGGNGSRHPSPPGASACPVRGYAGSYAFDDLLAEDAVGPNHQRQDHQDVRREVLRPAADVRINVARGHVLHDADDQPTEDRPRDRVEPAQDHDREDLEAHEREMHIDAEHAAPDHPRSEEHTSELQSPCNLVCRLLLEKKKIKKLVSLHSD